MREPSKGAPAFTFERPGQGVTNDWLTPRWILDALGPFDLDPCASESEPTRCAPRYFTWRENGLSQDWGGAFVWTNPPYGPHVGKWLAKLAEHGHGIALVFARTETAAMNPLLRRASCVLFLAGRLIFESADARARGNAGAPSMLLGYGEEARRRLMACSIPGVRMEAIS